ncbi:UPF0390 protein [Cryptococcus floricola]|uniref:UPF0390 protein n=1 Tax=Cryptococcus floricola TaxID=2591691 RepID=A0A5D3B7S1_9TREE|nr:UPF0390 protein [Cryptococcus floricola]
MAQGAGKSIKSKGKSTGSARKDVGKTKRGRRAAAPTKDKSRLAERAQNKEMSCKINNSIEKQMVNAASAGKLTIMRSVGEAGAGEGKDGAKAKGKK